MDPTAASKFMSYVLRHHPEDIGLQLDENGWARLSALIKKARDHGKPLSSTLIRQVLNSPGKQRFILSSDGKFIRAGYGHSIDIDLQLTSQQPPRLLYHGTARKHLPFIFADGLCARSRNFVHLSATEAEGRKVGRRHGTVVLLSVRAALMHQDGYSLYQSESESTIWLTQQVPPEFITDEL
ncbi:MAG: RNA 2'-phosphotransferase [Fodinibius sp.]|nr:RNA 2'-phosphotransferase [Fodinibius sp.]